MLFGSSVFLCKKKSNIYIVGGEKNAAGDAEPAEGYKRKQIGKLKVLVA